MFDSNRGIFCPLFHTIMCFIDSLPYDKFFDVSKLKAFADDKSNVTEMTIFHFEKEENTVGKGENAGYQHFLLFPQCFPKLSS